MNSTEGLIKKLVSSQASTDRDFSPMVRTSFSVFLFVTLSALGLYFIRPYSFVIHNPLHAFEMGAISLFLFSLTFLGFKAFIPGEKLSKSFFAALVTISLVAVAFALRTVESQTFSIVRPFCEFEAIGISLVTTVLAHILLKKNEFALNTHLSKSIFLSLPMIATVLMHGMCSLQLMHVFLCHVVSPLMVPAIYLIFRVKKDTGSVSSQ